MTASIGGDSPFLLCLLGLYAPPAPPLGDEQVQLLPLVFVHGILASCPVRSYHMGDPEVVRNLLQQSSQPPEELQGLIVLMRVDNGMHGSIM